MNRCTSATRKVLGTGNTKQNKDEKGMPDKGSVKGSQRNELKKKKTIKD